MLNNSASTVNVGHFEHTESVLFIINIKYIVNHKYDGRLHRVKSVVGIFDNSRGFRC